jgi:hypothetical protein
MDELHQAGSPARVVWARVRDGEVVERKEMR